MSCSLSIGITSVIVQIFNSCRWKETVQAESIHFLYTLYQTQVPNIVAFLASSRSSMDQYHGGYGSVARRRNVLMSTSTCTNTPCFTTLDDPWISVMKRWKLSLSANNDGKRRPTSGEEMESWRSHESTRCR